MSQNQEIIEAKLCAYIDGELDPEGKSEIEKHLESNPAHRRLLESLRATRDLLRWLPREQAPPELAETLNGQLERSVLLDYDGDPLRPRAWHRIFAAAAIILLTAGLGVAVYLTLPRSQKPSLALHSATSPDSESARQFTLNAPAASPAAMTPNADETPAVAEKQLDSLGRPADSGATNPVVAASNGPGLMKFKADASDKLGATDAKRPTEFADTRSGSVQNRGEIDQLAQQVAENPQVFSAPVNSVLASSQPAQAQGSPQNAMVMLVRSDSPDQTEKELTSYLDSQQLPWRQTPLPREPMQNSQSLTANSSQNSQTIEINKAMPESPSNWRNASPSPGAAATNGETLVGALKGSVAKDEVATQLAPSPAQSQPTLALSDSPVSPPPAAPLLPGASPSGSGGPSTPGLQQSSPIAANGGSYQSSNGLYVVQMTRRQAALLSDTIFRNATQSAQVKDVGSSDKPAPTSAGGGGSIAQAERKGMSRAGGMVGFNGSLEPTTNPSDREQFESKIAASAAGIRENHPSPLADQAKSPTTEPIAAAPTGEVRLAVAEPSPAAPAARFQLRDDAGAKVASTQPVEGNTLALESVGRDEPVNVVIMIEKNSSPSVVPATQPAGISAEQPSAPSTQPAENAK